MLELGTYELRREVVIVLIVQTLTTHGRPICKSPISAALRYSRGGVIAYQTESTVVGPEVCCSIEILLDLGDRVMWIESQELC
jgi:hypothetical protein